MSATKFSPEILPKILILTSYDLSGDSATDITLRSFFNHWPKDKLLIITTSGTSKPYCETISIKASFINKLRKFTLSILFGKNLRKDNKNIVPGTILSSSENKTNFKSRVYTIGAAYKDLLLPLLLKSKITRIKQFKPDIIYSTLGNISMMLLACRISKQLKTPILPHFLDDWPATRYTGSIWLLIPRLVLLHSLRRVFELIEVGLCISPKMSFEYHRRYKKNFVPLMNIINESEISAYSNDYRRIDNEILLTYFGGLHLNRWKTLVELDKAIETINRVKDFNIRLSIFTSDHDRRKFASIFSSNVTFRGYIDHSQIFARMKQFDYLIHIESFDSDVLKYIEFSISTKIPEYLASAKPIIAIGPITSASIEYLKRNNCAYIAENNSNKIIEIVLLNAISTSQNKELLDNAYRTLIKNHSIDQLNKLIDLILQIINQR